MLPLPLSNVEARAMWRTHWGALWAMQRRDSELLTPWKQS
jgi:hypothetical protein